jgi:hypothetical protein
MTLEQKIRAHIESEAEKSINRNFYELNEDDAINALKSRGNKNV